MVRTMAKQRNCVQHPNGHRPRSEHTADIWQLLVDLHDRGLLDVSAAPSQRLVTGLAVHATTPTRTFCRA